MFTIALRTTTTQSKATSKMMVSVATRVTRVTSDCCLLQNQIFTLQLNIT